MWIGNTHINYKLTSVSLLSRYITELLEISYIEYTKKVYGGIPEILKEDAKIMFKTKSEDRGWRAMLEMSTFIQVVLWQLFLGNQKTILFIIERNTCVPLKMNFGV